MTELGQAILIGLACYFSVSVMRALPPFKGLVSRGIRPWACDLCCSFWAAVVWSSALFVCGRVGLEPALWFGAGGTCLAVLGLLNNDMPEPPPDAFEFDEGGAREPENTEEYSRSESP